MKSNFFPGENGLVLILLFSLILYNCDRNRNNPGWDYFNDMAYSASYQTYSKNPNFPNKMTMRVPVEGTIPRDFTPFEYTIDPASRIEAGNELLNPFKPDSDVLTRGKKVYTIFCIGCHGTKGAGDGHLFTSGLYPMKPRTLSGSTAARLRDGEIFHSITLGFNTMGAHGSQILPDDRWKLILYIRKLQENVLQDSLKSRQ
jgi:cytochrome c5